MPVDHNLINQLAHQAQTIQPDNEKVSRILLPLLDVTSLNDCDDQQSIEKLCENVLSSPTPVAAVCIFPKFITIAKELLKETTTNIATVINFPFGTASLATTTNQIKQAIKAGANEIDIVMPYYDYLAQNRQHVSDYLSVCKKVCKNKAHLKVILETGILGKIDIIDSACRDAIDTGANFIKTSTGKTAVGATLEAAATILSVIKEKNVSTGLKLSGGINTTEQASQYLWLTEKIMGKDWIIPKHLRFGSSRLLTSLITN